MKTHPISLVSRVLVSLLTIVVAALLSANERVNLTTAGAEATGGVAFDPSVSADGRYVVFTTNVPLDPADANSDYDIYLRDRTLNQTIRLSKDTANGDPNGSSASPSISADGRFVAFSSNASDLVANDTNGQGDIFVVEVATGTITRVSVATGGTQSIGWASVHPSISGNGQYVVFSSAASNLVAVDTNHQVDIFLHDRNTTTTTRLSDGPGPVEGNGDSDSPVISADGKFVAFRSYATNQTGSATNGNAHIFVHDVMAGTTAIVSLSTTNQEANSDCHDPDISADGRYVVFDSTSTNLHPSDTEPHADIYRRDLTAGTTQLVSVSSGGTKGDMPSFAAKISDDGASVGFISQSTNLVSGDTNNKFDAFVRNLPSSSTTRVSVGSGGVEADEHSSTPDFTAAATAVVFESSASNLVAGDTNLTHDIFYRELAVAPTPDPAIERQKKVLKKKIMKTKRAFKRAKKAKNRRKAARLRKKWKRYTRQLRKL